MTQHEPMPDFSSHDTDKLQSSLKTIEQSFDGTDFYPELTDKAAALFYFMTKNHAFDNGNKRMAVSTVLFFLLKNGKWIYVDSHDLYEIAVKVASSNSANKSDIIDQLKEFLDRNIINAPKELHGIFE